MQAMARMVFSFFLRGTGTEKGKSGGWTRSGHPSRGMHFPALQRVAAPQEISCISRRTYILPHCKRMHAPAHTSTTRLLEMLPVSERSCKAMSSLRFRAGIDMPGYRLLPLRHVFRERCGYMRTQFESKHVWSRYNANRSRGPSSSGPRRPQVKSNLIASSQASLLARYGLPMIGLFVVATIVGPIFGALFISAIGFTLAISAAVAAFSLSWLLVPAILGVFGIPVLLGGAMLFTGAFTAMVLPSIIATALLLGGGLFLGSRIARFLFFDEKNREIEELKRYNQSLWDESTLELDSSTVDYFLEAEKELKEFDELLQRRDSFRRSGNQ